MLPCALLPFCVRGCCWSCLLEHVRRFTWSWYTHAIRTRRSSSTSWVLLQVPPCPACFADSPVGERGREWEWRRVQAVSEASAGSFKWRHVIPVESLTTRKRRGCAASFDAAELCCCRALLLPSVAASRIHCRHLLSYPVLRCCVHIYIYIYIHIYTYITRPTGSVGPGAQGQ